MISALQIINHIKKIGEQNLQDITFVMHEDGSGCFEDYFTAEVWQHFNNLKELTRIVKNGILGEIKDLN